MHEEVRSIPVARIDAGPYQPRLRFSEEKLEELAASIREHGLIQPVVVRPAGERYQLIAGERRLRAARRLGLETLPAIVREYGDEQALEAALVENLQREELTVVEEARAYERLAGEFGCSHGEIARRTGRSRAAVSNTLRLLHLPVAVLELLDSGALTEGHARTLLALPYGSLQEELAEWVVRNAVPVRETERKVRSLLAEAAPSPTAAPRPPPDAHLEALEARLRGHFGTRATVIYRQGRGAVQLEFYSDDDLWRILELLGLAEEG